MAQFGKAKQSSQFSVVVSGDLGEFERGQVLTKDMDIAEYIRVGMQEVNPDFDMDDDAILSVVKSIPFIATEGEDPATQGSSDWEITISEALESRTRSNEPKVRRDLSQTTSHGSIAAAQGALLDTDEAFRNELHIAGIAPLQNKRAGFRVLMAALKLKGYEIATDGTVLLQGDIDAYPRPGTYPEDNKGDMDKKWRPRKGQEDEYAEYYINVGNTSEKRDFYNDLVAATAEGKALLQDISDWALAIPKIGKNGKPGEGKYKNESTGYCYSQLNKYRLRYNSMVRATKVAFEAYFQMQELQEDDLMKSKIEVRFVMKHPDKDGNSWDDLTDGTDVIEVSSRTRRADMKTFTMSGFNNLDLNVAREKGSTYTALMESVKRGPKDEVKTLTGPWESKGKDMFLDNISPFHQWFQGGNVSEILKLCNERSKQTGERTESAKLLIISMCDLADEFATFKAQFGGKVYQSASKDIQDKIDAATSKAHADGVVEDMKKTA